ncbi:hypothetical protein KM043_001348 [Ampulex compressa]|nr:hypothetical protein KM043_001348 [Ampulex compressa]
MSARKGRERYAGNRRDGDILADGRSTSLRRFHRFAIASGFRTKLARMLVILTMAACCRAADSGECRPMSVRILTKTYDQQESSLCGTHSGNCATSSRRSFLPEETIEARPTVRPLSAKDVLSRLEAAVVLRDNLLELFGNVLLLCLNEASRVPFAVIHEAIRTRRLPAYDLLPQLPRLRHKLYRQQLYNLLQSVLRIGDRLFSEYAALCMDSLSDGSVRVELVAAMDVSAGIDDRTIASLREDMDRGRGVPLTANEAFDFVLRACREGRLPLDLNAVSTLLSNLGSIDATQPEVPDTLRFVAEYMKASSRPEDPLLEYLDPYEREDANAMVKEVLWRLEVAELPSDAHRESISVLLHHLGKSPHFPAPKWTDDPRKLLDLTTDRYPANVTAVAGCVLDHLRHFDLSTLDIGYYEEEEEYALLQVLARLNDRPSLSHLRKPLSILTSFVEQKLRYYRGGDSVVANDFFTIGRYLESFDTLCLSNNLTAAKKIMRALLTDALPWSYALGDGRSSEDPREVTLNALIDLRSVPLSNEQALAVDNFVYRARSRGPLGKRGLLYDLGIIFQREDSTKVELDLYSLLLRVPDVFKSDGFVPMLNFLAKPNILEILGYEFNKFAYEKPRSLLLGLLKRALELTAVKSERQLTRALEAARDYLEEPLLVNVYTSEDLRLLLKNLPGVERDSRYLPLKILFKKQRLFSHLLPTFSLAGFNSPMERLRLILSTINLKPTEPKLSESIAFALNSVDGPPLPASSFDREDFVYLCEQLLSSNDTLRKYILEASAYKDVAKWNLSVAGSPEIVLARAISYPVKRIKDDGRLSEAIKRARKILEEVDVVHGKILKRKTLEGMLEYLPDKTFLKPVTLLLRKSNLMTLVPKLKLETLENATAKDALSALLKNLIESRHIRKEKLLIRRLRTAVRDVEAMNESDRQNSLSSYLIQVLRDPSNEVYGPLIKKLKSGSNASVGLDDREDRLKGYLREILDSDDSTDLKRAAILALEELKYDGSTDIDWRANKRKIATVLTYLPNDRIVEPLRKLLTPDWALGLLSSSSKSLATMDREEVLEAILQRAKERGDVARNPSLTRAISKVEWGLGGWRRNVRGLKKIVSEVKSSVYDPVRELLMPAVLNKLGIAASKSNEGSPRKRLLSLLHRLMLHPRIKENRRVVGLINVVRQDVALLGVDVDLLGILDDMGIAFVDELAPLRLFLHKNEIGRRYGDAVLRLDEGKKRLEHLARLLREDAESRSDKRLLEAIDALKEIPIFVSGSNRSTIADLFDVVDAIPVRARKKYEDVDALFNRDILERLIVDNEIVLASDPSVTLLSRIMDLSDVARNRTLVGRLRKMRHELENRPSHAALTGFGLKPVLRELRHVQQLNVDYANGLLEPETLSYLGPFEFLDFPDDDAVALRMIFDYLLTEGPADNDIEMRKHLTRFQKAYDLTMGQNITSGEGPSSEDLRRMLSLIPSGKTYGPIRSFVRTREVFKYLPEDTDWKFYPTPQKKLLHLLAELENSDLDDESVLRSAKQLNQELRDRFDFVTKQELQRMTDVLKRLGPKARTAPLKIFLNHDNVIAHVPREFRYGNYSTPAEALTALLDSLLRVRGLKRREPLYRALTLARDALRPELDRNYRKAMTQMGPSTEELNFARILKAPSPKVRDLLAPENLSKLLPKSFTLYGLPTFKSKTVHLLKQLLRLKTDVGTALQGLLREVEGYPDVPSIAEKDLRPIVAIIPPSVARVDVLRRYLKATVLRGLLPGTFDAKATTNPRVVLHDVLQLIDITLDVPEDSTLKGVIGTLLTELKKVNSELIPEDSIMDVNDVRSVLMEIPWKKSSRLTKSEKYFSPAKVLRALPLNYDDRGYRTKKRRVLAMLNEILSTDEYRSWKKIIVFAGRLIAIMPDSPKIEQTDIEGLFSMLPMDSFQIDHLKSGCHLDAILPYVPINFDLGQLKTRKSKVVEIAKYCKAANPGNVSAKQALVNLDEAMAKMPNADVIDRRLRGTMGAIPCDRFRSIKPLLRLISEKDLAEYLPWGVDLDAASSFKKASLSLLAAMRNIGELQTVQMFSALDALEKNVHALPDLVTIDDARVAYLKVTPPLREAPAKAYTDLVARNETLIRMLPPTFKFNRTKVYLVSTQRFLSYSSTFLSLKDSELEAAKYARQFLNDSAKKEVKDFLRDHLDEYVPLKLYAMAHQEDLFRPIERIFRGYEHGHVHTMVRVTLKALAKSAIGSRALLEDIESFVRKWSIGDMSDYEIEESRAMIPSDEKYDDLRLYLECPNVLEKIYELGSNADRTPKRLFLDMLDIVQKTNDESQLSRDIAELRSKVRDEARAWEIERILRELPDHRFHASRLRAIESYFVLEGPAKILGKDYAQKYTSLRSRLLALNNSLGSLPVSSLSEELRREREYLGRLVKNESEPERHVARSIDDINVKSLFVALPKTRDERIILGILKFFSMPGLLRALKLPKDPFEYVTKGHLLQAILDKGQELESVQEDPRQQEALEYFRDKLTMTGPGGQPIELKNFAGNANIKVDLFGLTRALDLRKVNVSDAVILVKFFETQYSNLMHGVGFDQAAYRTRGAYLKAFLERLVNDSQVPVEVRAGMGRLLPGVLLSGPGRELVDLEEDEDRTPVSGMSEDGFKRHDVNVANRLDWSTGRRRFEAGGEPHLPEHFLESKQSLRTSIDDIIKELAMHSEDSDEDSDSGLGYNRNTRVILGKKRNKDGRKYKAAEEAAKPSNDDVSREAEQSPGILNEIRRTLTSLAKILTRNNESIGETTIAQGSPTKSLVVEKALPARDLRDERARSRRESVESKDLEKESEKRRIGMERAEGLTGEENRVVRPITQLSSETSFLGSSGKIRDDPRERHSHVLRTDRGPFFRPAASVEVSYEDTVVDASIGKDKSRGRGDSRRASEEDGRKEYPLDGRQVSSFSENGRLDDLLVDVKEAPIAGKTGESVSSVKKDLGRTFPNANGTVGRMKTNDIANFSRRSAPNFEGKLARVVGRGNFTEEGAGQLGVRKIEGQIRGARSPSIPKQRFSRNPGSRRNRSSGPESSASKNANEKISGVGRSRMRVAPCRYKVSEWRVEFGGAGREGRETRTINSISKH